MPPRMNFAPQGPTPRGVYSQGTCQVKVPPGCGPGSQFVAALPSGQRVQVQVPPGSGPGMLLVVQDPGPAATRPNTAGTAYPQHLATPVDTTGDGVPNARGWDTTGDGKVDSLDTTGDGRVDARCRKSTAPLARVEVTVPPGCVAGSIFKVMLPGGGQMLVTVPPGVGAGGTVVVDPPPPLQAPQVGGGAPEGGRGVQVKIPEGCHPGSKFKLFVKGKMMLVTVPPGVKPGDTIEVVVEQPTPSQTFPVVVPFGCTSGSKFRVVTPSGDTVIVQVPPGVNAGDVLQARPPRVPHAPRPPRAPPAPAVVEAKPAPTHGMPPSRARACWRARSQVAPPPSSAAPNPNKPDASDPGVPVDTNGDKNYDARGYDTNGDGKIDSLDTTGDGLIDKRLDNGCEPTLERMAMMLVAVPPDATPGQPLMVNTPYGQFSVQVPPSAHVGQKLRIQVPVYKMDAAAGDAPAAAPAAAPGNGGGVAAEEETQEQAMSDDNALIVLGKLVSAPEKKKLFRQMSAYIEGHEEGAVKERPERRGGRIKIKAAPAPADSADAADAPVAEVVSAPEDESPQGDAGPAHNFVQAIAI